MKKFISLIVVMTVVLAFGIAFAEGQPSAKSTTAVSSVQLLGTNPGVWEPILSSVIKTAEPKDLFVDVSLECGLYTSTLVKSKSGTPDISSATAGVKVRVLVDGVEALPGDVTFCRRTQELTAKFGGILNSCADLNGDGQIIINDECTITDEELQLVLDTMNANAFNFVKPDVGVGVHTVTVEAMINLGGAAQAGSYLAEATIGKGSVTIDEVRMVNK